MSNPLAKYESKILNENITVISTANGSMHMYLIKGDKRDILIDTGYGFGDLKGFINTLTKKEVVVINTHGHFDHVGSNDYFDLVYQSPKAKLDHGNDFGVKIENKSRIIHIHDKTSKIIEGVPFTFLECSSHSQSDVVIINERDRMLFSGDIIDKGQNIFVAHSDDQHYKDRVRLHIVAMEKILEYTSLFDVILPAHNTYPIEKTFINKIISLDKKILNDIAKVYPLDHKYMAASQDAKYFVRVREGDCSVVYRLPRIKQEN